MEEGYYSQEDYHKGYYHNVLKKLSGEMDPLEFSLLPSLKGEFELKDYIQPHYKETYRLAIDRLVKEGRESYHEFLKEQHMGSFLSEDELLFITANVKQLPPQDHIEDVVAPPDQDSSSDTYWPVHSDVETPNLDLGWPDVIPENLHTNINLLFHPPRLNNPTIKEVIRKHIQDARQAIGIVMDVFTDVDIFKETVDASLRGVSVYVLLNDFHFKSFLKMVEDQDVKLQQLRNMRVRIVKGQEYLCRSGAKFQGAMEQKFLVIDCHTAIYGSYSFTWSYEKIHLSMVQVITGHLMKSYDEEFRILYARSTVPAELSQPEGLIQKNGSKELPKSHSLLQHGRRDQLRRSLDVINQKGYERKYGTRDLKEEGNMLGPLIENDISLHHRMPQLLQFETTESINLLKRHSYAGERQDGHTPHNIRPKGNHLNIFRNTGNGPKIYAVDNYMQMPEISRSQNMRQSYNGIDKPLLSMQQNIPTLENTSKAFMRTWRIDSYLKNSDCPTPDAFDYLDQFEISDKAGSFMQGRMRNSLVLRSTMPEQMESNRNMYNSPAAVGLSATPNALLHFSSTQWDSSAADNRVNVHDYLLKKQNLQIVDDTQYNAGYGLFRNASQNAFASLGRTKHGQIIGNPDIVTDNWRKRHSVADPRSNTELTPEPSGQKYNPCSRTPINRSTTDISVPNGGCRSNLSEDQRSVSQFDVKHVTETINSTNPGWQNTPSRTMSAAALDTKSKPVINRANSSQHILKNKMKSQSNTSEKTDFYKTKETPSLVSSESTNTLTPEEEEETGRSQQGTTSSVKSSSNSSKPQTKTEEQLSPKNLVTKSTTPKKTSNLEKNSRPGSESRLSSRFEPFCSFEKKNPRSIGLRRSLPQEKSKSVSKAEPAAEHTWATRGHGENRLERFFQRVGNLIHKNKQ